MKKLLFALTLLYFNTANAADLSKIQSEVTFIEHYKINNAEKIQKYEELFNSIENTDTAENLTWKGIILAVKAKYVKQETGKLAALSLVKQSKELLIKAIKKSNCAADGAALNALGILYHEIPSWPIGFGSNEKANQYFIEALKCNPKNPDVLRRQGEFFVKQGKTTEGFNNLKLASILFQKRNRPEDSYKKQDVDQLISNLQTKSK